MPTQIAKELNRIMCDGTTIMRELQRAVRREMDRRCIALKVVAADAGLSPSTVASYFPADPAKDPAVMPMSVLWTLIHKKALPTAVLSMLVPDDAAIIRLPEGVDHDQAAAAMHDYLATKVSFHRPDSECGPALGPNESATLTEKLAAVPGAGGV